MLLLQITGSTRFDCSIIYSITTTTRKSVSTPCANISGLRIPPSPEQKKRTHSQLATAAAGYGCSVATNILDAHSYSAHTCMARSLTLTSFDTGVALGCSHEKQNNTDLIKYPFRVIAASILSYCCCLLLYPSPESMPSQIIDWIIHIYHK